MCDPEGCSTVWGAVGGGGGGTPLRRGGGPHPPPFVDPNPAPFPAGPVQARKHTKLTRCTVNGDCFAALQHFQSRTECCLEFAQRPFLPLVTNHRHKCREAKGATDIYIEKIGRRGASSIGIILPLVACPLAGTLGASTLLWPGCLCSASAASGSPTASKRGTKSEVAHLWAKWLHNPCRLGEPHRFRAGDKIRSGPLVGKVAT